MVTPIFIGDEVSAAGFRLAGVRIRTPQPEDVLREVEWACKNAPLILITSEFAATLSAQEIDRFLAQETPAVLIVPDVRAKVVVEDLNTRLRSQLGIVE